MSFQFRWVVFSSIVALIFIQSLSAKAQSSMDSTARAASEDTQHQGEAGEGDEEGFRREYGPSGCGLGSMVYGDKRGMIQIFAATTNNLSSTQIFGISSGTSNCVDQGRVVEKMKVPLYIETNYLVLAKEAAQGRGETLQTLAQLMGCHHSSLVQLLQKRHGEIFVVGRSPFETLQSIEDFSRAEKACPVL